MKKQFNKAVAIVASATLILSSVTPAFADGKGLERFSDVSGHWAVNDLTSLAEKGIMGGYPDNTMRPQQPVTIAESIKLINKSLQLEGTGNVSTIKYTDVKKDAWYSNEIAIAVEKGYLAKVAPGEKLNPNAAATREQLSSMIAQAMELNVKNNTVLDKFADNTKISSSLKPDMAAAVEKGLFGGYEDGTIRPKEKVIRATMAAVANRTINEKNGTQSDAVVLGANDMLVSSYGETVSGKTVDTLWIAPEKGEGVITLENVNAKKVIVMGKNTQLEIKNTVQPQAKERRAKDAEIVYSIGEIEIRVPNVGIVVRKGSIVDLIRIRLEAIGSKVSGDGTLNKIIILGDNAKIDIVGAKFEVAKDVKGTVINKQAVSGNVSGTTITGGIKKDSTGGGGGGGGSSSGGVTVPSHNYAFIVSDGTDTGNLVEKVYSENTTMNFATVSSAYSAIGDLSDAGIAKAMPTVREVLALTNADNVKYVDVLEEKIASTPGLSVFTGDVKTYVSAIAAENDVDANMNLLTKELLKAGLDSMLSDLTKMFPNSSLPDTISVKVIGTDGALKDLSDRTIKNAQATINSQLGIVPFSVVSTEKTVLEVKMNNTVLSLKVKKMS